MSGMGTERRLASIVALDVAGYSARTEADEPQPRTGRLRGLMEAVVAAAGQAGAVAQAALNVLAVISKIPW